MNSGRQDFSASVLTSVIQSVRQSVLNAVSQTLIEIRATPELFILTGFVPDAGFGNGWFASSDWPANKQERDVIFDPFLSPRNIICFGTRQAVFSVTRNRFRNRKQLARKGWKTPPESSFFTGHSVCRGRIPDSRRILASFTQDPFEMRPKFNHTALENGSLQAQKRGRFCRIIPSNKPHLARFSAEKSSQTGTISERSETFFNPGSQQSECGFRQKRQRVRVQKRVDSPVGNRPFLNSSSPNSQPFGTGKWLSEST